MLTPVSTPSTAPDTPPIRPNPVLRGVNQALSLLSSPSSASSDEDESPRVSFRRMSRPASQGAPLDYLLLPGGDSFLHDAIRRGNEIPHSSFRRYIDVKNDLGQTPLHIACLVGNLHAIGEIVKVARAKEYLGIKGYYIRHMAMYCDDGMDAIGYSIASGQEASLVAILNSGANVFSEYVEKNLQTLATLPGFDHLALARDLIFYSMGATETRPSGGDVYPRCYDAYGRTALHHAALSSDLGVEKVSYIIRMGTCLWDEDMNGDTVLKLVYRRKRTDGRSPMCDYITDAEHFLLGGVDSSILSSEKLSNFCRARGPQGSSIFHNRLETVIDEAGFKEFEEEVEMLREAGANPFQVDDVGRKPFYDKPIVQKMFSAFVRKNMVKRQMGVPSSTGPTEKDCKICFEETSAPCVYSPCGHGVFHEECTQRNPTSDRCPICFIRGKSMRIFI